MQTAGIIGGIGPEATIDYYRAIVSAYRARPDAQGYPPVIINSIDMTKMLHMIEANQLEPLAAFLSDELDRLRSSGADFGLLASNTPHIVFEEIRRRSSLPLISIVETACEAAEAMRLKKLGLFGSRFTMQGSFYSEVFARANIAIAVPNREEQAYIHDRYMSELVNGIFLPETRRQLLAIAGRVKERENIQGLILGGTELPLILRDVEDCGIPFLDTTQIHVKAALARILSDGSPA